MKGNKSINVTKMIKALNVGERVVFDDMEVDAIYIVTLTSKLKHALHRNLHCSYRAENNGKIIVRRDE